MMQFVVFGLDKPDMVQKRLEYYEAHKAHLARAPFTIQNSGPLIEDDGSAMIGSLLIVEADDRSVVEQFFNADPFYLAGIYAVREIRAYRRRI